METGEAVNGMMTVEEMRAKKKLFGYTNEDLAQRSGVPLATVQKVLAGVTKAPRRKTLEALSRALGEGPYFVLHDPNVSVYKEEGSNHTIEEIQALPEYIRAELIDGEIYYLAAPTWTHQKIVGTLHLTIANYINSRGGPCQVAFSPVDVYLNADGSNLVEPDLFVVCDPNKIKEKGCYGAPDWVIEVVSPSSRQHDAVRKLRKYREAGVREFWLIHYDKRMIQIHYFGEDEDVALYSFDDEVPSGVIDGLTIRLSDTL